MNFRIVEAKGKSGLKKFIKSQWYFYENDPNFVPPIIADRMKLLDKEKNPFYKHADYKLFLAEAGGNVVGRIAAITNENHNKIHNDNIGFFGFFECVNDDFIAAALFDEAEKWLKEKGKDRIRGPVNPSMNDEVALLIDGFDRPPVVLMTYNPPYYAELIENYGFEKAKDLYAYNVVSKSYRTEKMIRMQDLIKKRYKITIRNVDFKNKEQFRKDVDTLKDIYNRAWQPNWGFVKMTDEEFDFLAADLKQIANPLFTMIVESDGKPAGFCLALPDINECLIHNKSGSLIGALWHLLTKKKNITWLRIIVLGVLPEFQRTGIDAVLYNELGVRGDTIGITNAEASWILEDNLMMNRGMTETLNADRYKTYRIYEKSI